MAVPKNNKHKDYVRYAEHCLKMVPQAPDQEDRNVQREMAAEWLKLADAVLHPPKRMTGSKAIDAGAARRQRSPPPVQSEQFCSDCGRAPPIVVNSGSTPYV